MMDVLAQCGRYLHKVLCMYAVSWISSLLCVHLVSLEKEIPFFFFKIFVLGGVDIYLPHGYQWLNCSDFRFYIIPLLFSLTLDSCPPLPRHL